MAFCENCIHYDICRFDSELIPEQVTFFPHNEDCSSFISKADVVEVRCKDCKYYVFHEYYGMHLCENHDAPFYKVEFSVAMKPTDFCSYGERRETNAE